jgi:hypothetical protein
MMSPLRANRGRSLVIALSLLGFSLLTAGCNSSGSGGASETNTSGKVNPGLKRIQDARSKVDAGKK